MAGIKLFAVHGGESKKGSNFHKTFLDPIEKGELDEIEWAGTEYDLSDIKVKELNNSKDTNYILIHAKPETPHAKRHKYLGLLKKGNCIKIDNNINPNWKYPNETKYTRYYNIQLLFKLPEKVFDGILPQGKRSFFEIKKGSSNEELYKKFEESLEHILFYSTPYIVNL